MNKDEELKQEAEEWLDDERKYIIEDNEGNLINISKKVKEAYLASAEPREKRITELEAINNKISDECHKLVDTLEKKQKEVAELEKGNAELTKQKEKLNSDYNKLLDEKIELEDRLAECKACY